MEATQAAAVARATAGEHDDFRTLVERHGRHVFRLAFRLTGNEHDAEEVVQETFLRAYRGFRRFEARSQVGTWLHRIAVNCAMDLLRARQRDEKAESLDAFEPGQAPHQVADRAPDPERLLYSAEVERRVANALRRLTPTERAAFVLRHFEGASIEEIRHALGLGEAAAKHSVFRAVQKLRAALQTLVDPMR